MSLILKEVSKIYNTDSNKKYALNKFSYTFPRCGLVSVVGKSGCGKSTLLNMISLIDKPSEGKIIYNGKTINKYKGNKLAKYHNKKIGIVFQHYNLLENETPLFNAALPLLINNYGRRKAYKKVKELAKRLNIKEELLKKKTSDLSGGEKQRIALLRAIINNPEIVIADEPTGALDSQNSTEIMELLKSISKTKLVIMVSHNSSLVYKYSDQIINLRDGEITSTQIINKNIKQDKVKKEKVFKFGNDWISFQGFKLLKRKALKNFISFLSLFISLTASFIIIGFINGSEGAITSNAYRQIDYGVITVSHEESMKISGSKFSIIQESHPSNSEVNELRKKYPNIIFEENLSFFFPNNISISIGENELNNINYTPIYSFDLIDEKLLIEGRLPLTSKEVLINQNTKKYLEKRGVNALNSVISLSSIKDLHYESNLEEGKIIDDLFVYKTNMIIVGVVDDFSFLSTNNIYYSYVDALSYLQSEVVGNLSMYLNDEITYYDFLYLNDYSSDYFDYSIYGFYLDYDSYDVLDEIIKENKDTLVFSSSGIEKKNACNELISAMSMGMEVFLFISLIGTMMIIGILSFSCYSEDKKKIAIMYSVGANEDDISSIYLFNNLILSFISFILCLFSISKIEEIINSIIYYFSGIDKLINIPLLTYFDIPYFLITIISISLIIIILFSTCLPILFSNKVSLKEVLKEE